MVIQEELPLVCEGFITPDGIYDNVDNFYIQEFKNALVKDTSNSWGDIDIH